MEQFAKQYLELIQGPLKGLNLTRIIEFGEFFNKQIIDSLAPLDYSEKFKEIMENDTPLLDVGFGGGFPLLPLAYKFPNKKFIGIEARRKKADAVNMIAKEMGLLNVTALHERLENIWFDEETIITFKAVGNIDQLLPLIIGDKKQRAFFYKGPLLNDKENLELVSKDWELIVDENFPLEGTEGRRFLGFEGVTVPRGTKKNKQLVKVSNLV